jgi:hypothetical protein
VAGVDAHVGEECGHPTILKRAWLRIPFGQRGVAQPGQSIGLQNRGPRVRILPPLPSARTITARCFEERNSLVDAIRITGSDVDDKGRLILVLSETPSRDWEELWVQHWRNPSSTSRGFRKTVYKFFQGNQIVLEVSVDDFVKHHKRVAQDAVKAANAGVVKLEAVHRDRDRKAAEDEKLRLTATEREREKARRVKFD